MVSGRHRARVFNPNKPNKYHLKGFSLNEADSGYCLGLYMGKDEKRPRGVTATEWPTRFLLGGYPEVHQQDYILYADNWFTGLGTVLYAASLGVGYAGTARTNRIKKVNMLLFFTCVMTTIYFQAFVKTAEATKGWVRGDYRAVKAKVGDVDVYCTQWMDSKVVTMLSTFPSVLGTVARNTTTVKNGKYERKEFDQPSCIGAYNGGMGGTDLMDQYVASYYANRRLRWHVKVILHLFRIALVNAYVTWCGVHELHKDKRGGLLAFIFKLVEEIDTPDESFKGQMGDKHTPTKHPKRKTPNANANELFRSPPKLSEAERSRERCKVCKKRAGQWCKECGVFLHVDTSNRSVVCWTKWHSTLHVAKQKAGDEADNSDD